MKVKETTQISFDDYQIMMTNHSPAFALLTIQVRKLLYESYVINGKLNKPQLTIDLLCSKN